MRIIQLSDLHINSKKNFETTKIAIDDAINKIKNISNIDLIVICGDIFHNYKTNALERNYFSEIAQKLASVAKLIILKGNHDRNNELDIYRKINSDRGIIVINDFDHWRYNDFFRIAFLPNIDKSQVKGDYKQFLLSKLEELKELDNVILFAHYPIKGALLENGECYERGIGINDLKNTGAIYVGLGDIHGYQKLSNNIYYSGSINRNTFAELDDKGFLVININNEVKKLEKVEFIKVKAREIFVLEWEVDSWFLNKENIGTLKNKVFSFKGDVKVIVSIKKNDDKFEGIKEEIEIFKKCTSGEFVLDMNIIPETNIRDEKYKEKITIEDKIKHYIETNKIECNQENIIKKLGEL